MSVLILIPDQNIVRSAKCCCVTYENDTLLHRQKLLIFNRPMDNYCCFDLWQLVLSIYFGTMKKISSIKLMYWTIFMFLGLKNCWNMRSIKPFTTIMFPYLCFFQTISAKDMRNFWTNWVILPSVCLVTQCQGHNVDNLNVVEEIHHGIMW